LTYVFWFGVVLLTLCVLFIVGMNVWRWWWNRSQPVEEIPVRIVAKRTEVSGGANDTSTRTDYYVTFEHKEGQRHEFPVTGPEYGMLAEGDRGILTYQGEWFKGFRRKMSSEV
jgi:hypothetical protein